MLPACPHAGLSRSGRDVEEDIKVSTCKHCYSSAFYTAAQRQEVFLTSDYICIAMEFASSGNLFNYVKQAIRLKEAAARWGLNMEIGNVNILFYALQAWLAARMIALILCAIDATQELFNS